MLVIIGGVVVGAAFLLGMLAGGEIQKHLLRGHEGTRADRLRMLRRRRAEHVRRRQIELYGRPGPAAPRAPWDDEDKWWRRHARGEPPVRRSREDPPRDRAR